MWTYIDRASPWAEYAESITAAVLPEGPTSIGYQAFKDCSGIVTLTVCGYA